MNYLRLKFDIVGVEKTQLAQVRPDLLVGDLTREIRRQFDINEQDDHLLYRAGHTQPLDNKRTLIDQGIENDDQLNFTHPTLLQRKPIRASKKAQLQLDSDPPVTYEIQWQPAIIGRPDNDATHTSLLAVNLEWLGKQAKRVSRRHAQIIERDGAYLIESLTPNNPTFVNDKVLVPGEQRILAHKDTIRLRMSRVQMQFLLSEE